jgi:hypothetical protein
VVYAAATMQPNGDESETRQTTTRLGQRYTVQQAAKILGTTVDGVRSRIRRGSLNSMKVEGQVYVLLSSDQSGPVETRLDWSQPSPDQSPDAVTEALLEAKDETIGELRDRVEHLRRELEARNEELRRKDHLLAAALEKVPAIEAPAEASLEHRGSPVSASDDAGEGDASPDPEKPVSRLRQFLFGS